MFPGNGVHRGLRYVFLVLVGVSEMSANQQQHVYKPLGIKETDRYTTIEDIRRHVCRKSFIVTAYQHDDDDEFVSKCN